MRYHPVAFCHRTRVRANLAGARLFLGGGSGQVNGLGTGLV